jgi:ribosomal protein S18 acetylase RimI-like enzyme
MRGRAFTVREARPEEYARIGALTVAAYRTLGDDALDDYEDELADVAGRAAVCPVLVAVADDGSIVGTVTYVPGPDSPLAEMERQGEAGFRMLAVAPAARGRQVGRRLVEAAVQRARAEGRSGLAIVTRPTMTAAHRLYESVGFERDPERDWEYEPGRWLWAMALPLTPGAAPGAAPRPAPGAAPRPARD